jgi:hypothetical protein
MPPDLTPERYADLLRKLDEVCEQARDLARHVKTQMAARARGNHQLLSAGNNPDENERRANTATVLRDVRGTVPRLVAVSADVFVGAGIYW